MFQKLSLSFILFFACSSVFGQLTQTIRGTVTDSDSKKPLENAKVIVRDSLKNLGTISDVDGNYRIENVPVGRVAIEVRFFGYETASYDNLDLTAGKELVLNIELHESVVQIEEVTIKARKEGETINELATVSARQFSVEASKRYAGSVNDVSRMAQNFAGVQGNNDSRNDIIIRGNSPVGVLYRFEGVDIPNPNHFALLGTAGGPVSILNNNLLDNSDFMTGAFPAEYGNALAGVFDLKLRNGNNQQHEFLGQFGFNGAELMAEGPISKDKKSSYLVSYRYSSLKLFALMGIDFGTGTAVPDYQDVNFKLNFPNKKGYTAVFGIGGLSEVEFIGATDDEALNLFTGNDEDVFFFSKIGVLGIKNMYRINDKGYIKTTISTSATYNGIKRDSISFPGLERVPTYGDHSMQGKNNINTQLNYKFNSKHLLRTGIVADRMYFDLRDSLLLTPENQWVNLTDFTGSVYVIQPFAQWQYKINPRWTVNSGVHYQLFTLNNDQSLEPRASIQFNANERNVFSLGYGRHSQVPPTRIYYQQVQLSDGSYQKPNKELEMTRADHYVLSYDFRLTPKLNFNVETYYQQIFNVPVDVNNNSYSILNYGSGFVNYFPDTLVNSGKGTNYGIEFTLEHYMTKGLYFMFTSSLYESKYSGSDNIEYNSNFNGNYTFNLLGGKEFFFKSNQEEGKKQKVHSLLVDVRTTLTGGQRHTPVDENASVAAGRIIYYENRINELKYKDYFRADLRIAYKVSKKKFTQEWAIELRNVTNQKNIFLQEFDVTTGQYATTYQTGFLPIGQWRIEF